MIYFSLKVLLTGSGCIGFLLFGSSFPLLLSILSQLHVCVSFLRPARFLELAFDSLESRDVYLKGHRHDCSPFFSICIIYNAIVMHFQ